MILIFDVASVRNDVRGLFQKLKNERERKENDLVLFHVIPAPYQVRAKLRPESSCFKALRTDWTRFLQG